jgi:redox-sensitive bicupin YhaK (pirin superfamily)
LESNIIKSGKLGFQLQVLSPYIIGFHHKDRFPAGNGKMEPISYISTRIKGNDFREDVPYRMYHGERIPGFPYHPHRGFETVTVVIKGMIDHADGLSLAGRYGDGDVQWMTAGKGLQHSEMFPVLDTENENLLELFQIWVNLPKKSKFVDPHYKMLWNENIPVITQKDENGYETSIKIINGAYKDITYLDANPDSWAHEPNNHVNIWLIEMEPNAVIVLPGISSTLNRGLYCYEGDSFQIEEQVLPGRSYAFLKGDRDTRIVNGATTSRLLLLDGEPINEPVVAYGPFVMNTEEEIEQAYRDYQRTGFGGWPWSSDEPVHPADKGRFALYPDEKMEYPPKACGGLQK